MGNQLWMDATEEEEENMVLGLELPAQDGGGEDRRVIRPPSLICVFSTIWEGKRVETYCALVFSSSASLLFAQSF